MMSKFCLVFLLIFLPLHASNKEFNTIRGFWKLKITGPLIDYDIIKECNLKVSGDLKKMEFGSVYEDQYQIKVELCGGTKKECKDFYKALKELEKSLNENVE